MDPVRIRQALEESTAKMIAQEADINDESRNTLPQTLQDESTLSSPFEDQPQENISSMPQTAAECKLMVENLEDALESAREVIHSAQASIASLREGSVRSNASVAVSDQGSLFNHKSRLRIDNWVSGNIIEEESSSDSEFGTEDIDLELILSKRLQVEGDQHFELKEFPAAEDDYRLSLRHYDKAKKQTSEQRVQLKLKLALVRVQQQKWKDIEELLSALLVVSIEETKSVDVLTAWHLVAEYRLHQDMFKEAESICQKVLKRRRDLLRKKDPAQEESMQLLVRIIQAEAAKLKDKAAELISHGIDIDNQQFDCDAEVRRVALEGTNIQLMELLLTLPEVDLRSTCKEGLTALAYSLVKENNPLHSILVQKDDSASDSDFTNLTLWKNQVEYIPELVYNLTLCRMAFDRNLFSNVIFSERWMHRMSFCMGNGEHLLKKVVKDSQHCNTSYPGLKNHVRGTFKLDLEIAEMLAD